MKTVLEKVKDVISDQIGIAAHEIQPGASLIEDLDADSLDLVEFAMALEDEFEIELPDEDAENFKTVQDIADYIESKQK